MKNSDSSIMYLRRSLYQPRNSVREGSHNLQIKILCLDSIFINVISSKPIMREWMACIIEMNTQEFIILMITFLVINVVFINLGTNWQPNGDITREDYLREIVELAIDRGVLPILSTKGDNIEGNHKVNEGIAKVASEYDIPLWNFWRSIQYLSGHGIDKDRGGNYLSVAAWNMRSYSGLRMLHAIHVELMGLHGASSD